MISEQLDKAAHALRLVRVVRGEAAHFTATTFPRAPWAGCALMLRRAQICGDLGNPGDPLGDTWVDVLAEVGDIVQEWPTGRRSFAYLRRKLGAVRERPNAKSQATDAALSRHVACTDGLCSSTPKKGDE